MTSTIESLLTIPPFAPSGLEPRRRRRHSPEHALFRDGTLAMSWHELPLGPVLVFAYVAVLVTFFASLH